MRRHKLLLALLATSLTGCSGNIAGTASQLCNTWKPVYVSKDDKLTKGTTEQIAASNAANEVWCGVRPETKPVS